MRPFRQDKCNELQGNIKSVAVAFERNPGSCVGVTGSDDCPAAVTESAETFWFYFLRLFEEAVSPAAMGMAQRPRDAEKRSRKEFRPRFVKRCCAAGERGEFLQFRPDVRCARKKPPRLPETTRRRRE